MANGSTPAPSIPDLIWGAQIGTYEYCADLDRLLWSSEQRRLYGIPGTPASTAEFYQMIHPEDRDRVEAESNAIAGSTVTTYSHSFRIKRPDGEVRVILDRGSILRNADGTLKTIRGVNVDVTDDAHLNYAAEARLRASEQRYRKLFDAIDEGFCILEVCHQDGQIDYRVIEANPAFYTTTGFPQSVLNQWLRTAAPGLEDHWYQTYGEVARTGQASRFEGRSDLLGKWFDVYAFPIDAPGENHVAVLFNDISDRKHKEEQTQLLVHEINHRSKNTLGVVQAIARQTADGSEDDFLARFGERVRALAASHDLLVRNSWVTVSLCELVRTQLSPFADLFNSRITARGPLVSLTPEATKALGMAFHELLTNSAKYGALLTPTGQIAIDWTLDEAATGDRLLKIDWVESGGPTVAPPSHKGFGTNVITRMAEASTGGTVTVNYAPAGLHWHFVCSAANILA